MSQALELVERLRVEWLVHELGDPEQRARARETALQMIRDAGGVCEGSCWVEPVQWRLSVWCADGSAFVMKGHRDGMKPVAGAELVLAGVFGPYDASDEHLSAWILGLIS